MPTQKDCSSMKMLRGGAADGALGAARVGDEGVWRGVARDFRKQFDRGGNWERDVDEIRAAHGSGEVRRRFVNSIAGAGLLKNWLTIESDDARRRKMRSKRERERSADESRAEYGNAVKCGGGVFSHFIYAMRRPTAGAIMRHSVISCAN